MDLNRLLSCGVLIVSGPVSSTVTTPTVAAMPGGAPGTPSAKNKLPQAVTVSNFQLLFFIRMKWNEEIYLGPKRRPLINLPVSESDS